MKNLRLWALTLTTALAAALAVGALTGWWEVDRRQTAWTEACRRVWSDTEAHDALVGYFHHLQSIASTPVDQALGRLGPLAGDGRYWVWDGDRADQVLAPLAAGLRHGDYLPGGRLTELEIEVIRLGAVTVEAEAAIHNGGRRLRWANSDDRDCLGPLPLPEPSMPSLITIHWAVTGRGFGEEHRLLFPDDGDAPPLWPHRYDQP